MSEEFKSSFYEKRNNDELVTEIGFKMKNDYYDYNLKQSFNCNIKGETKNLESTSDKRVVNNVVRHEYRVLNEAEKDQIRMIKDCGLEFIELIKDISAIDGPTRELSLATTKIEEAVFWAVKSVTK